MYACPSRIVSLLAALFVTFHASRVFAQKQGVTITETGGKTEVAEGGATDSYQIVLDALPATAVTISIAIPADLRTDKGSVTFTTGNWGTPQTVAVTAMDDFLDEEFTTAVITHSATSGDPAYNGIAARAVVVSITDNDKSAVLIAESSGKTEVAEGGAADGYQVVLATQPSTDVVVTISPAAAQLATDKSTLTFTPVNWSNAQTVVVSAIDDWIDEGPHAATIAHTASSSDPAYNGVFIAEVLVSLVDNDLTTFAEISAISSVTLAHRLTFKSLSRHFYRAEHCSNLVSVTEWTLLTNNIPGSGDPIMLTDPTTVPMRFYRVRARPSPWPLP